MLTAPDTTAPTASFSPIDEATAVVVSANIILTFSEDILRGVGYIVLKTVSGIALATYDAATSSNLSISGSTLNINPTADLGYSTAYKLEFAAGTIKDLAGNSYAGTTSYNFTTTAAPDTTAPTLAITSSASTLASGQTATITFTFSEAPTGFAASDVTTTGGTLGTPTVSSTDTKVYTTTFTPTASLASGSASITVASASYTDAAGNSGSAGTTPTISIDTLAPTLTITSSASALKAGETATITFTFNEAPTGFAASDITTTGGTLGTPTVSSTDTKVYTATFTPTASLASGTASITVASASYTDAAGNSGGAGTTPTINIDTLAPTLAITSSTATLASGQTATITFTFSEAPAGFAASDVTTTGGTLGTPTVSSTNTKVYTATFTPTANLASGSASITVAGGSYTDAAGNSGGAGTTPTISIDTLAPTISTFSPADEAIGVAVAANIVLAFGEAIALGTGNIVLKTEAGTTIATYDAATSSNLSISGSTLTINPTADLGYSTAYNVEFALGTITDGAGNSYAGTTSYNFTTIAAPDTTAPTITTFSPADEATGVAIAANIVLTFSESVVARSGGTIELMTDYGSGHQSVEVFSVVDATRVKISGNVVTIDPTSALLPSTGYHLGFNNALADTAGNAFSYTHGQYNFTTVATSSGNLRGIAYDWKNHMLLQDVAVSVKGGGTPAEGANAPIQFKGLVWDASGHASVEVWTHASTAVQNAGFGLEITNASGITFTAGTLPNTNTGGTGWTLITNASGTNITVAGFANNSTAAIAAGDFKLGTITFETATAQRADLHLLSGDVGTANATAYGLSMARTSTSATGAYSISTLEPGSYGVTASRAVTDIGNAITSADALAALKMAVGLNPNPDPDGTGPLSAPVVSPYQFMAADVIGTDGRVTSADVLAILKMAVKLPTAPAKEWMFVEESRDFWNETTGQFTLNRNSTGWDHSISTTLQTGTTTGTVNLVGVLKGDVNGSWAAPAGSTDLDTIDPTHFTALSSIFGMPVGQFGVV